MKSEIKILAELRRVEMQIEKIEESYRGTGVDPRTALAIEYTRLEVLRWVLLP